MKECLTLSAISFLLCSVFVVLLCCTAKQYIIGFIISLIISFLSGCLVYSNPTTLQIDKWNNGTCINCHNADYRLITVVGKSQSYFKYFYQCPNCGYTIEENTLKNK